MNTCWLFGDSPVLESLDALLLWQIWWLLVAFPCPLIFQHLWLVAIVAFECLVYRASECLVYHLVPLFLCGDCERSKNCASLCFSLVFMSFHDAVLLGIDILPAGYLWSIIFAMRNVLTL